MDDITTCDEIDSFSSEDEQYYSDDEELERYKSSLVVVGEEADNEEVDDSELEEEDDNELIIDDNSDDDSIIMDEVDRDDLSQGFDEDDKVVMDQHESLLLLDLDNDNEISMEEEDSSREEKLIQGLDNMRKEKEELDSLIEEVEVQYEEMVGEFNEIMGGVQEEEEFGNASCIHSTCSDNQGKNKSNNIVKQKSTTDLPLLVQGNTADKFDSSDDNSDKEGTTTASLTSSTTPESSDEEELTVNMVDAFTEPGAEGRQKLKELYDKFYEPLHPGSKVHSKTLATRIKGKL